MQGRGKVILDISQIRLTSRQNQNFYKRKCLLQELVELVLFARRKLARNRKIFPVFSTTASRIVLSRKFVKLHVGSRLRTPSKWHTCSVKCTVFMLFQRSAWYTHAIKSRHESEKVSAVTKSWFHERRGKAERSKKRLCILPSALRTAGRSSGWLDTAGLR